jgi:hypothetical protein
LIDKTIQTIFLTMYLPRYALQHYELTTSHNGEYAETSLQGTAACMVIVSSLTGALPALFGTRAINFMIKPAETFFDRRYEDQVQVITLVQV